MLSISLISVHTTAELLTLGRRTGHAYQGMNFTDTRASCRLMLHCLRTCIEPCTRRTRQWIHRPGDQFLYHGGGVSARHQARSPRRLARSARSAEERFLPGRYNETTSILTLTLSQCQMASCRVYDPFRSHFDAMCTEYIRGDERGGQSRSKA